MKLHVITAFLFGSCAMVASALEFRVVDHANRPIEGGRVSLRESASVYTDAKGRAQLKGVAELKIKVEAQGFEGQTRVVERKEAGEMQLFTLGRSGMHYYYPRKGQRSRLSRCLGRSVFSPKEKNGERRSRHGSCRGHC